MSSTEHAQVTVLVVDDEPDMRLLVRMLLERPDAGIKVVAEAADGDDALAAWRALDRPEQPSVVVLDNRMPGRDGLSAAGEMLGECPKQTIIIFSAHLDADLVEQAMSLGVAACLDKNDATRLPVMVRELARADG